MTALFHVVEQNILEFGQWIVVKILNVELHYSMYSLNYMAKQAVCSQQNIVNWPQILQEMEQLNNFKYDMPEVSEVLTSFFTGSEKQKPRAVKSNKKRQ
jgi:hypothetical protein